MSSRNLSWSSDGSKMPSVNPHTLAKHQILSTYIEHLIITLYGKVFPHGVQTFTFIDGFCGGGIYKDSKTKDCRKGSPPILIEAVREGFKKSSRNHPLNVRYVFVDSKQEHIQCLKNYSMPYWGLECLTDEEEHIFKGEESELTERCEFIAGRFEDMRNYCVSISSLRKGHSFFLLDPAGWDDVSIESIRAINEIPGSEILYTHMIEQLKRFVIGKCGVEKEKFEKLMEAEGYYEKSKLFDFNKPGQQMYLRNETARLFREKGFKRLDSARYLITFALIPKGTTQVLYYLIHMSRNITALEVIKERFCESHTMDYQYQFEVYGYGFRTFDLKSNKEQLSLEPAFYEEEYTSLTFNMNSDCLDWSIFIEKLDSQIANLIFNSRDGITFIQICQKVGEFNPASRAMYEQYINYLRDNGDVEIFDKDGLISTSKYVKLRRKDVIKVSSKRYFQGSLLYKSRFFREE